MAEQAEDLGISAKPVPLLPPRPVPPHPADLLPPRMSAPPVPGSDPSAVSHADPNEPRQLIVGHGVSLSGEITSCARLIIEGNVEANLHDCHDVDIAETGHFKGVAAIDNAEVRGRFEGDLVVRKRLLVRSTGHVSGTITYGIFRARSLTARSRSSTVARSRARSKSIAKEISLRINRVPAAPRAPARHVS